MNSADFSSDSTAQNSPEERLVRMETLIAELERMVEELNRAVMDQANALRRLQSQQSKVSETVENIELERIRSTNPKPPHSAI
ncbi:MAG: SlyX family protein [Verrucomicrobia bacterium]|nr:SlyX family protein [Verrucomicrobiota bacterium]MBI3867126.1 SlyX family protein [Verrucomicrobiota bacterium]